MPTKTDAAGNRWVEMEIVVPGTREQVWQAMATGPGNSGWFTQAEVDERVGGTIRFDFGPDGGSQGEITCWEPPHKFGYVERDWNPGAPPVATEITITGRSDGQCLMRMVHLIESSSAEWDEHLAGFEEGWSLFFEVLRLYLSHFAGRPAAATRVGVVCPCSELEAWSKLTAALGLSGKQVGERWEAAIGDSRYAGTIERIHQGRTWRDAIIRLDQPGDGIALFGCFSYGGVVRASISIYANGDDAMSRVQAAKTEWTAWCEQMLAANE